MSHDNYLLRQEPAITADALTAMIEKEQGTYRCQDYLSIFQGAANTTLEEDRQLLVDWCYAIIDGYKFQRETVTIGINLMDRFLSTPSPMSLIALRDRCELQLLAVTTLYIAIKINERVAFPSDFFSTISQGRYSVQEIEEAEVMVLTGLSWYINSPTVLDIAMHILSLLNVETILDEESKDRVIKKVHNEAENAVRIYIFAIKRPSSVALTILLKSFRQLGYDERIQLFASLLPVLQAFDFDNSCKKSIALGVMRLEISRRESIRSLDNF